MLLWKALSKLPKLTTLLMEAEPEQFSESFEMSFFFNYLDLMTQIR